MKLPNDNDFGLTKGVDNENEMLRQEIVRLTDEINKMQIEAVQASQTLMQLVAENFQLKDQNQALIAENESVIREYEKTQKKLESVTKVGNRLVEIIEEIQD